ncbi:MAG: hypothetical protein EAX96_03880 [Candidatus Lokiarchaeota archaeon]|nr:hypothetical protein [Candidatus Lokiarchaeota archaeon]
MTGWITIAKNEIRKYTSRFRKNRLAFWIIVYSIIITICTLIPLLTHIFIDPIIQSTLTMMGFPGLIPIPLEVVSWILPFITPLLHLGFLMMFLMSMLYPVQYTLQDLNIGHLEAILSAPIRPRDVLFGEFAGQIPIFSIAISIGASIIITILSLVIQMNAFLIIGIIIIIILTFLTATWLGTILSAYLSMKFGFSEKGKDRAKAFMMVFGFIMVLPILLLEFIPLYFPWLLLHPVFTAILQLFPSSWAADTILILIFLGTPITYVGSIPFFNTYTIPFMLIGFYFAIFYFGYLVIDKIYTFEAETRSTTITIAKENLFFGFTKKYLGPFFTVQLKEFFRRSENLSRLAYSVIMSLVFPIIMVMLPQIGGGIDIQEYQTYMVPMIITMTGFMFSIFFGLMMGSYIMIRSKDMVWIYKKSPRGTNTLATSFFWSMSFLAIFLAVPVSIIISVVMQFNFFYWLLFFIFIMVYTFGALLLAIGIQCINPAFKEKSGKMYVNTFMLMGLLMIPFFLVIFIDIGFGTGLSPFSIQMFATPLVLLGLGILIFYIGLQKLGNLE